MCATPDKKATEEFRNRAGPQRAYKVIGKQTGRPSLFRGWGFRYRPGRNVDPRATRKSYAAYLRRTGGLHCYLSRAAAVKRRFDRDSFTVVCVTYDPADVIVAESARWPDGDRRLYRQVVVRALNISDRAWKQAGLPARKSGGEELPD